MQTDYQTKYKFNDLFVRDHMTQNDIVNYYQFNNAFSNEEIDWIIENMSKLESVDGYVGSNTDSKINDKVRKSIIRWIPMNESTEFIYERVYNMVIEANNELYGFDLWGIGEEIQFTEYYEGGDHYDWHLDIGPNQSRRKISITIQLSDPDSYEGGELELRWSGIPLTIPKEKGLATLFPSFMLHRIRPVTKGVRRSLVLWFTGPSYR